ncbi:hypothetical protein C0J52_23450 [Blattella germanica]|nr:hypothetical protein C0J52_23450 [Blattella germanica]
MEVTPNIYQPEDMVLDNVQCCEPMEVDLNVMETVVDEPYAIKQQDAMQLDPEDLEPLEKMELYQDWQRTPEAMQIDQEMTDSMQVGIQQYRMDMDCDEEEPMEIGRFI